MPAAVPPLNPQFHPVFKCTDHNWELSPKSQGKKTLAFVAVPFHLSLLLMFNILLIHHILQSVWDNYIHSVHNIILSQYKMNLQASGPDFSLYLLKDVFGWEC